MRQRKRVRDLLPELADVATLGLDETGVPSTPLLIVALDDVAEVDTAAVARAADAIARSPRVTVGAARSEPPPAAQPLLDALTLSFVSGVRPDDAPRSVVCVADVDDAIADLQRCIGASPQASIALGLLLRHAAQLDLVGGLAAEAAVYSLLLSGREFRQWLERRDPPRPLNADAPTGVELRRSGERLDIVLDRPERHNAMDASMREQLYEAFALVLLDESITEVHLRGGGPSFSSGGDLAEFGTATDLVAASLVRLDRAPWRLLAQVGARVHAHVHGATIGAGMELAAFAGHVSAMPGTLFALPEVGMGLIPGAGGTVSIPRRIGRWRAAWLMLTGARIDAATALSWGLVDSVGPSAV